MTMKRLQSLGGGALLMLAATSIVSAQQPPAAVSLNRMDGAQWGSIEVAREKAYSAVAFRRPTKAFEDAIGQGGVNLRILRLPGASPLEGGLPIVVDGKLVGAVGVSSVTAQQDAQIGRAGIEALK